MTPLKLETLPLAKSTHWHSYNSEGLMTPPLCPCKPVVLDMAGLLDSVNHTAKLDWVYTRRKLEPGTKH